MGLFDALFRRQSARTSTSAWAPPPRPEPEASWQVNLNAFAAKVAQESSAAGIALHYDDGQRRQYPFWIVSADVYQGVRWPYWARSAGPRPEPPPDEHVRAHLLLLTTDGQLVETDSFFGPYESGPTGSGAASGWGIFERNSWAWQNIGTWRETRNNAEGFREEWRASYRQTRHADPGYGTSAALSTFRRTHSTQWPGKFDGAETFASFRRHRTDNR